MDKVLHAAPMVTRDGEIHPVHAEVVMDAARDMVITKVDQAAGDVPEAIRLLMEATVIMIMIIAAAAMRMSLEVHHVGAIAMTMMNSMKTVDADAAVITEATQDGNADFY